MPEPIAEETLFLHKAEIGLGTWSWGDRTMWNYGHGYAENDIEQAFQSSLAAGINFMDSAEVYGGGRSERFLGKFLKSTSTPSLGSNQVHAISVEIEPRRFNAFARLKPGTTWA